ncbi:uncharacterized protein LOC115750993 [Rhodamnia argentea]|uniref:Uncharacterized protein LOC115750993 n=1 Tax=Rhodamnia argentea TaxID=178133 RepID=A0A8B8QBL7_9MYRT|nr:uncharacterized protein LOC115750993 [Rhodamnia argentea]
MGSPIIDGSRTAKPKLHAIGKKQKERVKKKKGGGYAHRVRVAPTATPQLLSSNTVLPAESRSRRPRALFAGLANPLADEVTEICKNPKADLELRFAGASSVSNGKPANVFEAVDHRSSALLGGSSNSCSRLRFDWLQRSNLREERLTEELGHLLVTAKEVYSSRMIHLGENPKDVLLDIWGKNFSHMFSYIIPSDYAQSRCSYFVQSTLDFQVSFVLGRWLMSGWCIGSNLSGVILFYLCNQPSS